MKNLISIIFAIMLALAVIACTAEKKEEAKTEQEPATTTVTADTAKITCAGCGMVHTKAEMTAHEIDGETMHFCSEQCKEHYLATREKESETPPPAN
jgi:YHS domain-containing protein